MCGIYGAIKSDLSLTDMGKSLKKLEYRGYDSCGIAYYDSGEIKCIKKVGNVDSFLNEVKNKAVPYAIAHTRWATHGEVTVNNAHPHFSALKEIYLVHNGILKNYESLKVKYSKELYESQTDSEVLVHMLEEKMKDMSILKAIKTTMKEIDGNYAIIFILSSQKRIYFMVNNSPLCIQYNNGYILSSDPLTFHDKKYLSLNNQTYGYVSNSSLCVYNTNPYTKCYYEEEKINEGYEELNDKYFMHQEIYQELDLVQKLAYKYWNDSDSYLVDILKNEKVIFIGAGSSYYAGMYAQMLSRSIGLYENECVIASEHEVSYDAFYIIFSQSGETIDIINALCDVLKEKKILFTNNINSYLAKNVDSIYYLECYPEISVASTKAFFSQCLSFYFNIIPRERIIKSSYEIIRDLKNIYKRETEIANLAKQSIKYKKIFYIATGTDYVLALEGALKLKEISYLNAFAIPSGELKHGSIALIDEDTLVIAISLNKVHNLKVKSAINEIKSRKGCVIEVSTDNGAQFILNESNGNFYQAIIYIQLFAYHCALYLNRNVDQPRNLAKSVTVE